MEKKINLKKEMTKSQKLEKLAITLRQLRSIKHDNELQKAYIQVYWKKLWKFTDGDNFTINSSQYSELVEITNKIFDEQCKLEVLLNKMIDSTLYNIDNV